MAIESDADRANFFDPQEFGIEALYAPRDGSAPYVVTGIYDEPATDFHPAQWPGGHQYSMQEGARFASTMPTFKCRSADLMKGGKGRDKLTIGDTVWTVRESKPDGTGIVVLVLSDEGAEASEI